MQINNFATLFVWVWNAVYYTEDRTQTSSVTEESAQEIYGPKNNTLSWQRSGY